MKENGKRSPELFGSKFEYSKAAPSGKPQLREGGRGVVALVALLQVGLVKDVKSENQLGAFRPFSSTLSGPRISTWRFGGERVVLKCGACRERKRETNTY